MDLPSKSSKFFNISKCCMIFLENHDRHHQNKAKLKCNEKPRNATPNAIFFWVL
jgi:hypothetical protein